MNIKVPLVRQKKKSVDCGLACLNMIFGYYGFNKTISSLKKEIKVHKAGLYAPQIGSYLLKEGFSVEIKLLNPGIFTLLHKNKDSKYILKHFQELLRDKSYKLDRRVIKYFINFIKIGGVVKPEIPHAGNIRKEIKGKRPVITLNTTNYLTAKKPKYDFHYNVITGIDKRYIYCNDPDWDNSGGKKKFLINEYMFGIHASSYGGLDNGCLILIKRHGRKK